ncbi:hypothetical protein PRIPAC_91286 [Pristionchus pacificus]|uniref:Uncharacterized protein n=1 Tax=Pristionchus pacificus TaxID=54126 RepID=A0A2A6B8X1_PRIPA|nr:hypothetical protein PRIPAC_91286 [Pristionchus pacificus]|eukprot:PDM62332.1 hypothetical protein PRIPAC_51774 [Pristionchus pacificus]
MLEILSDYVLPVFVIVAIAVQARLILVLSTKNKTVPPIFRVIILHILASHIGVSVFGLSRWFIYYVGPSELKKELCACKIARYALVVTYLTDYHVNNGAGMMWIAAAVVLVTDMQFDIGVLELVACILAVATTLTYLITLAYWKFVKACWQIFMPKITIFRKAECRSLLFYHEPPSLLFLFLQVLFRDDSAIILSFSVDIFGNIYALYYFISIQPTSKYFKRQEFSLNCTTIRQHQEGEILQITFQLREIMFPILLIVLFRKIRCLFISKNAYIVLKRGGTQKSMETAHL